MSEYTGAVTKSPRTWITLRWVGGATPRVVSVLLDSVRGPEALGCPGVVNVVAAAGEVGSHTATAASGRHVSSVAWAGQGIEVGRPLEGWEGRQIKVCMHVYVYVYMHACVQCMHICICGRACADTRVRLRCPPHRPGVKKNTSFCTKKLIDLCTSIQPT